MSDEITRLVWDGLLDAERLYRYYGHLAAKLERTDQWLARIAAGTSSASIVSALIGLFGWPWLPGALAVLASVITIWLTSGRNSSKAIKSAMIRRKYSDLLLEWESLWYDASTIGEAVTFKRWRELSAKSTEISDGADVELPEDKKLAKQSEYEAYEYRHQAHAT